MLVEEPSTTGPSARSPRWSSPEAVNAVAGLDFTEFHHLDAKGITAVVRYTGAVIPEADVRRAIDELRQ